MSYMPIKIPLFAIIFICESQLEGDKHSEYYSEYRMVDPNLNTAMMF